MKAKLRLVLFLVVLWFLINVFFLARLQLLNNEYRELARKQFTLKLKRPPIRGNIYDRYMRPMALSIPRIDVYQRLEEIEDHIGILEKLGIEPYEDVDRFPKLLKRNVPIEYKELLLSRKVKGVFLVKTVQRIYPFKEEAKNIVGFSLPPPESRGVEGLEKTLDEFIRGKEGYEVFFQSADGRRFLLPERERNEPTKGEDVITTLDMEIQRIAYEHLKEAVIREEANWGFAIVLEPYTGEVLAIAQYPSSYRNYAIQYMYEPGSTFKVFPLAKALEKGIIEPSEKVFVRKEGIVIDGIRIKNVKEVEGYITWKQALEQSVNSAFAKLGLRLGGLELYEIAIRMGFGIRTDILLNGETNGIVKLRKRRIDIANMAIGQGLSVNGMQMAMAYACIANGGKLLAPRLLKRIGEQTFTDEVFVRRCLDESIATKIKELLVSVVDSGSGKLARIEGMKVAGKTGTSQKFDRERGEYSQEKVITSFIGFLPADKPRYLIYVVLDEPKHNKFGGTSAAPVFRKIAEDILLYERIAWRSKP